MFVPINENEFRVYMEVDRKAKGFSGFLSEMAGTDETKVSFILGTPDVQVVRQNIVEILEKYS